MEITVRNKEKPIVKQPTMSDVGPGKLARMKNKSVGYNQPDDIIIGTDKPPGWFYLKGGCYWSKASYPDVAGWPVEFLSEDEVVELRNTT